jgi:hypothetical protein
MYQENLYNREVVNVNNGIILSNNRLVKNGDTVWFKVNNVIENRPHRQK